MIQNFTTLNEANQNCALLILRILKVSQEASKNETNKKAG